MISELFAGNEMLGYVATGVLAFCLGVTLTLWFIRIMKHREEKDDDRTV
ncbi:MAG: hypothetical protein IK016_04470 [Lachnospiraceae bacterium]|nr:hypothetical protein [Lachnospiraceae bacterium]